MLSLTVNITCNSTIDLKSKLAAEILVYLDTMVRIYSELLHLVYFLLVIFIKNQQTKNLLYVHHLNFISFAFNTHYFAYFNFTRPNIDKKLIEYRIVCTMSEILWSSLKNLRTNSIALIAFYRLISVFRIGVFMRLNQGKIPILLPLLIIYLWTALNVALPKFVFKTTYGPMYCFDGYSKVFLNSLGYFLYQSFLGILLPTMFAIGSYFLISKKFNSIKYLRSNFVRSRSASLGGSNQRLTKQFLLLDMFELLSCGMLVGLDTRHLIKGFDEYYSIQRLLLRMMNILFQSFIPLITIISNPFIVKKLREKYCSMIQFISNKLKF
jgi:hypothetical protein